VNHTLNPYMGPRKSLGMNLFSKSASEDADFETKYKNLCSWLRSISDQNKEILYQLKIQRFDEGSSVTQRYKPSPEGVPYISNGVEEV